MDCGRACHALHFGCNSGCFIIIIIVFLGEEKFWGMTVHVFSNECSLFIYLFISLMKGGKTYIKKNTTFIYISLIINAAVHDERTRLVPKLNAGCNCVLSSEANLNPIEFGEVRGQERENGVGEGKREREERKGRE